MSVKVAQVSLALSEKNNAPQITIVGDPGAFNGADGIPLRVYPPGCQFFTTAGTVTPGATRTVPVMGEMLTFSNSDSASLKYLPMGPVTFEVLWSMDDHAQPVGGLRFKVDSNTGYVRVNVPFTGMVRTSAYQTQYQSIRYKPEIEQSMSLVSSWPNLHVTYGVIAAIKNGGMGTFEVPLPTIPSGTDKVELWRVVSNTVLDPDGEWEKPQTWGAGYTGKYADNKTGPNAESSILKERVHEIGYATRTGMVTWYDQFSRSLAQPYTGFIKDTETPNFQPVFSLRKQVPSQLFPEDVFAQQSVGRYIAEREAMRKFIRGGLP